MPQPIAIVDAFTTEPFAGNPAGVCLLQAPADAEWMQRVANEMNLSETAFLAPEGAGFHLRWFTPTQEMPLCGHATLASAHYLWEQGVLAPDATAQFRTLSGALTCTRQGDHIVMNFPAQTPSPATPQAGVMPALGNPTTVATAYNPETHVHLIEVPDEATVRGMRPDFAALKAVTQHGIIVTCRATTPGYDFISRFFAPAIGINEDPVTGGAHCALAPYWAAKLDRSELTGFQASARGGVVQVRYLGDRVDLIGSAVTVLRGELLA